MAPNAKGCYCWNSGCFALWSASEALGDACISLDIRHLLCPILTMYCKGRLYMTFFPTRSGDFVGTPPQVRNIRDTRGAGPARVYKSLRWSLRDHPDFKFYDEAAHLLYPAHDPEGGRKKIVAENIHELLTPRRRPTADPTPGLLGRWLLYVRKKSNLCCFNALVSAGGSRKTCTSFKRSL